MKVIQIQNINLCPNNLSLLVKNRDIYRISKRFLQKQTFKTNEKLYSKTDLKSKKIEPPSIFALPSSDLIDATILNSILIPLTEKNRFIAYSLEVYAQIFINLQRLESLGQKNLYREYNASPQEILDIFKNYDEGTYYIQAAEIVEKFNVNHFRTLDAEQSSSKNIYLSVEGAYEVDKFLRFYQAPKAEDPAYKPVSFDKEFFSKKIQKISEEITTKNKQLDSLPDSATKHITKLVYTKLILLSINYLNSYIRNLFTLLYKTNKISFEQEGIIQIKYNDITYTKLDIPYAGVIIEFGKMFMTVHYEVFIIKDHKTNPNLDVLFSYILTHLPKNNESIFKKDIFEVYKNEAIISLKVQGKNTPQISKLTVKNITQIENALLRTIKKSDIPLDHKMIENIIYFYYQYKESNVWKEDKQNFKIKFMYNFVNKSMVKIHSIVGETLLQLLDGFIHINKQDNSSIYINDEFFWTTNQSNKYPSFGIKQVTFDDTEDITKQKSKNKRDKFIYKSLSYTHTQPMINYSSKYHLDDANAEFTDQIQNSSNMYICKINEVPFIHFLKAITQFIDHREGVLEVSEDLLKYLLPNETNLIFLKSNLTEEQYKNVINFICDLEKLSYKDFIKETKIYDLKDFIVACISTKLEIRNILSMLWIIISFTHWYPRVWADARGRQYPFEMPLNITKSPKWRSLFYYITYLNDAKNTDKYLAENTKIVKNKITALDKQIAALQTTIINKFNKKGIKVNDNKQ